MSDWINYCGGSRPALLRLADLDFGEPRKSASGGREGGLGTVELAILKALKSRAHVATDMLPAIVAHFEAKQEWNTRAGEIIYRYPDVAPAELARVRASLSRALKTLMHKGLITRSGRQIVLVHN